MHKLLRKGLHIKRLAIKKITALELSVNDNAVSDKASGNFRKSAVAEIIVAYTLSKLV